MLDTPLYSLCAVAGWTATGYVLRLVRRAPSSARWAHFAGLGFFSFGVTMAIPPVAAAIDAATHTRVLAKLLAHAGTVGTAASAAWMMLALALPPEQARRRATRWAWATVAAFTVMAALAGYTGVAHPQARLMVEYARVPSVTAYLVVYLIVPAGYLFVIARLCRRYAAVAGHRRWLRRGMLLTSVGSYLALGYCANKTLYLTGYWLGYRPSGERQIAAVLITIAALLNLIGLTLPSWGPALVTPRRWRGQLRAYRALAPLWRDLIARLPDLELDPALRRPLPVWRDADYALTRRVAEVRDGRLALRAYIDQRVTALAGEQARRAGLTGDDRQAVVEAAQLAAAVRGHAAGLPAPRPDPTPPHDPGGYAREVAWLVRVAEAYARSPVVAAVAARAGEIYADDADAPSLAGGGGR